MTNTALLLASDPPQPLLSFRGSSPNCVAAFSAGSKAATTHSRAPGSILGDVVITLEHLERLLNDTSTDPIAELERARDLMRSALDRTRKNEPCLRGHLFPPE